MTPAPGVEVSGLYHDTDRGDFWTPTNHSWVDPDSLEITGRPDLVAQYLADNGIDASEWDEKPDSRGGYLADLANDLREHVEEQD